MKHNLLIILLLFAISFFGSFTNSDEERPHAYNIEYSSIYSVPDIPANNPLTKEGVWLGKLLFYDPILSVNSKIACSNCHKQKLFFTDGRPLAIGTHGDTLTRNTMSLVNLSWNKNFFWDGRDTSIEEVVIDHIRNVKEMGGINEKELISRLKLHQHYPALFKKAFPNELISLFTISKAIAQFTRTIVLNFGSGPEEYKDKSNLKNRDILNESSHAGSIARVAFMQCKYCHGKAAGGQVMAVYLNDSVYKAPTFVNIKSTGPYMHDGRFKTLKDVFNFYNENLENIKAKNPKLMGNALVSSKFTEYDIEHADEIFSGNEDTSITTNVKFSNPFIQTGFNWQDQD